MSSRKGAWSAGLSVDVIREAMDARGLSQETLARSVGVTRAAIGFWLSGACIPVAATQKRLLEVVQGGGSVPAPARPSSSSPASSFRKTGRRSPVAWLPKLGPEVLREHLQESGLTHAAYCAAHGLTRSALQTWISGKKAPTPKTQRRLLKILRGAEPLPTSPVPEHAPAESKRVVLCPTCKGTGEFSLTPDELRDLIARRHAEVQT